MRMAKKFAFGLVAAVISGGVAFAVTTNSPAVTEGASAGACPCGAACECVVCDCATNRCCESTGLCSERGCCGDAGRG